MAFPPDPVAADKAPGPPSSPYEHPNHHNELATAINDTVTELGAVKTTAEAAVPASIVDAKGDIVTATAAATVATLPVGTDTHVLTADSSTPTGLKWAAPPETAAYQPLDDDLTTLAAGNLPANLEATLDGQYLSVLPGSGVAAQIIAGGVLRNGGASDYWQPLDDGTHVPIGIASVTTSSSQIVITLDAPVSKRITCIVVPDEYLAGDGVFCGASFSTTEIRIEIGQTQIVEDYISYNGSAWTSLNGTVSITSFTGGVLTLSHPTVRGGAVAITGRGGTYVPLLSTASQAVADTTTKVSFYDWAGTLVTTPDTNMRIAFTKSWHGTQNPQNVGTDASANLWFVAFAEAA